MVAATQAECMLFVHQWMVELADPGDEQRQADMHCLAGLAKPFPNMVCQSPALCLHLKILRSTSGCFHSCSSSASRDSWLPPMLWAGQVRTGRAQGELSRQPVAPVWWQVSRGRQCASHTQAATSLPCTASLPLSRLHSGGCLAAPLVLVLGVQAALGKHLWGGQGGAD